MASLDKLLGLFATPRANQRQEQASLGSDGDGTIGLEDFGQLGHREEWLARETLSASPPGFLGRTLGGDLFTLVRVRIELINLFFIVAGLAEGVDGVGRRKGCVLVGVVGHRGRFSSQTGKGGGRVGGGGGNAGERGGDVAVRSTDHRRGNFSSYSPLTRGNTAARPDASIQILFLL